MRRDINHPSIITWTLVNESWGYDLGGGDVRQRNHIRSLYYQTKSLDPTRAINDNCGWEHVQTDLSTFHDYADANGMRERCQSLKEIIGRGRSMFLSKFSTTIPNNHNHTTFPPLLPVSSQSPLSIQPKPPPPPLPTQKQQQIPSTAPPTASSTQAPATSPAPPSSAPNSAASTSPPPTTTTPTTHHPENPTGATPPPATPQIYSIASTT